MIVYHREGMRKEEPGTGKPSLSMPPAPYQCLDFTVEQGLCVSWCSIHSIIPCDPLLFW